MALIARFALCLTGIVALAGCERSAEPARDWPTPSPAVWQVTAPGGGTGWLFGTIHALPDELRWRTPALDEIAARSGVLVVEIAELDDARLATQAFQTASHKSDLPPLSQRLPQAARARLAVLLAEANLTETDLAATKTWAAALILNSALRRTDPANGAERALIADAGAIIGLETFAGQYARFDALSSRAQVALVTDVLREPKTADEQLAQNDVRIEAWLTGDLSRLEALSADGMLHDPELREALLASRTRAWAQRIARLVERGQRPLVAVGAGHMLWDDGLPALLAKRGFTVRRVQ